MPPEAGVRRRPYDSYCRDIHQEKFRRDRPPEAEIFAGFGPGGLLAGASGDDPERFSPHAVPLCGDRRGRSDGMRPAKRIRRL